jgi:ABC-2 type transport system permease protein
MHGTIQVEATTSNGKGAADQRSITVISGRPMRKGLRLRSTPIRMSAMAKGMSPGAGASSPLMLLVGVHLLQLWRRLRAVGEQSRLLTAVIGLFITGYLAISFWLFYRGLKFIAAFPGLGTVLTERLLYVLFACLFVLLLLSNLVISYTNFFRNRETAFLLTQPVRWETVFRWKFMESTLLASWAFLFLIAPLLAAFGLTRGAPWHFYVVTLGLTALFILLPGLLGSWLAIHLGRHFDRRSFQVTLIGCGVLLLAAVAFWLKVQPASDDLLESRVLAVLDRMLIRTRVAQYPWLPSFWLTTSVLQWADGVFRTAFFFMMVLLSYVTFFGFLAVTRLGEPLYDTASAVQSRSAAYGERGGRRKGLAGSGPWLSWTERALSRLRLLIPADVGALLLKDARMFWRDTTQWGQSVVLFGLLGVYILNLRHFTHQLEGAFWINLIAYLNLSACSLNLATLTTRFVFPQFSLEGHRLWIIGLAPLGLGRVVKVKYWLASAASLAVTLTLISLSCHLLRLPWTQGVFFAAVVSVMTFSLNGLAVGLGVLFPNFKETNPNKIVSGFGGTLCLVLSFLYILGSVLMLGFGTAGWHARSGWVIESILGFVLLSALIGWLPLQLSLRRLRDFEF